MNKFGFSSIGRKLTVVICTIIALGFGVIVFFYAQQQQKNIILQNERAIHQILLSITEGLNSVMITGSADVAEIYAEKLKGVKGVEDFRILRTNGVEAFKDNLTIEEVNTFRKEADFELRPAADAKTVQILPADDQNLKQALLTQQFTYFYKKRHGTEQLSFLQPIKNAKKCHRCHDQQRTVLGVLEFTTSLDSVKETVRQTWMQAGVVLAISLVVVLFVTTAVLNRYIIRPIEAVSAAMNRVSAGDLSQTVPVFGKDELSAMARSFNVMSKQLQASYDGFNTEHNKLETIIMGTDEGIVVTDGSGKIVLVNSSAEKLLHKSAAEVVESGFLNLLDDPKRMEQSLDRAARNSLEPDIFLFRHRFLAVYVSSIKRADGHLLGHAAVIRDMTKEKQLEQMLRDLSNTDPLTGIANRRYLDEILNREFALAREQGRALSIMMMDVDHFKKFNDTYGHDQGDRVLQVFATTVRGRVRENLDAVCRYGGEEFMVIARDTPQEGAAVLADRIRQAVEAMVVDGLQVTTSIGVAGLQETGAATPSELTERADAALYQAKDAGRNRVVAAASGEA